MTNRNIDPRVEANRANARKSTGPRTAEGKLRSSLNNRKHGLTGAHAILPGEDPEAFDLLKETLLAQFPTHSEIEAHLIDELAQAQWKLARAERMEAAALARSLDAASGLPALTDETVRIARYQAGIRRAWHNAFTRLRQARADRQRCLGELLDRHLGNDDSNPVRPQPPRPEPLSGAPSSPHPDPAPGSTNAPAPSEGPPAGPARR